MDNREINNLVVMYQRTEEDKYFEEVWVAMQPNVHKGLQGWSKSLHTTPDELKQLAMEKLLDLMRKFNPDKGHFTSLYKVALKNYYTDIYRKQQTRVKNGLQEIHYTEHSHFETAVYQEGIVYEKEKAPDMGLIIMHLNDADKELIIMRYVENLTVVEIADKLGVSRQAIYKKLNRIYKKLEETTVDLLKD